MNKEQILRKLEGLHTVETVMVQLDIKKQSAINLLSRLKKQQHITVIGGGNKKRLYKITMRKQRPRRDGMFDILNRYSPKMKLNPWYDHQVHGEYTVEDALVESIQTKSFRAVLVSVNLFPQIRDWPKLYTLAKENNCWNKIGALYDVSRKYMRVKKMPNLYPKEGKGKWHKLTQLHKKNYPKISNKWHVFIPFNENDLREAI
jgi:hypothetical protein